jgi:hypothetical protein
MADSLIGPILDVARPLAPGVRWTATTTHGVHLILPDREAAATVARALRDAGHAARALDHRVLLDT